VGTVVLPLSVVKLPLAASWWERMKPDATFDRYRAGANSENPSASVRISVHEMIVTGSDEAGRQMAAALRRSAGSAAPAADFVRYGFVSPPGAARDEEFWAEVAPAWRARLTPARAYAALTDALTDAEWDDALSLGQENFGVTALHVSRFLQAVGNGGRMIAPTAREERPLVNARATRRPRAKSRRVMREEAALRLQAAMLDVVRRGTATSIAESLKETGWQIGGKTGSGPGDPRDGWFAGLVFDPKGRARLTVATHVRRGGVGGGNAAKISAGLARFIIGAVD
jgi:hypothetical protein